MNENSEEANPGTENNLSLPETGGKGEQGVANWYMISFFGVTTVQSVNIQKNTELYAFKKVYFMVHEFYLNKKYIKNVDQVSSV